MKRECMHGIECSQQNCPMMSCVLHEWDKELLVTISQSTLWSSCKCRLLMYRFLLSPHSTTQRWWAHECQVQDVRGSVCKSLVWCSGCSNFQCSLICVAHVLCLTALSLLIMLSQKFNELSRMSWWHCFEEYLLSLYALIITCTVYFVNGRVK